MKIGSIYRLKRPYAKTPKIVDNLENYFYVTNSPGKRLATIEKGINKIEKINAIDGDRIPAILISSSPHKSGSKDSPWEDYFDPDNGHIHYYGDNKIRNKMLGAEDSPGNALLLQEFEKYRTGDDSLREKAVPLIFFKRVSVGNRKKGNVMFQGFGIIENLQKVTQKDTETGEYFSNYTFDFIVLNMMGEGEVFNWDWITARRDPTLSLKDTLKYAPDAWKTFINQGITTIPKIRRRVSAFQTLDPVTQKPEPGSREESVLQEIYQHYSSKRYLFEWLAAKVTENIINKDEAHTDYFNGWVTRGSNDGGGDFVGRLDIGTGFSTVNVIILGQAKCEKLTVPTNGQHIARTVARLKRGWIGVYVTTSYFSQNVQMEIIEDQYPLLLINGLTVAKEVIKMSHKEGLHISEFLDKLDSEYNKMVMHKRPEEILRF